MYHVLTHRGSALRYVGTETVEVLTEDLGGVSSANMSIRVWTFKGTSLMNNTESKGPTMEPCGTPAVIVLTVCPLNETS